MFEAYLGNPKRNIKNAHILEKYQADIDALSTMFSEDDLLSLMTRAGPGNAVFMKSAREVLYVLPSSGVNSNQINFFQDTSYWYKWRELQQQEFHRAAVLIYKNSSRKNKIPQAIIEQLDKFILQEIGNAGRCKKGILSLFLHSFLDNMYHSEKFMNPVENYQNGVANFRHFQRTLTRYNTYVTNHLQSTEWLKRVPKVGHLEQDDVSTLVFTYFCSKYFFNYIFNVISFMKTTQIITNGYLHHPKMVPIITLSMLPYDVLSEIYKKNGYNIELTSPDEFIVKNTFQTGKANLTGYKKTTEQLIRKTYIYIALLLHPEWSPSAKEVRTFLEGKNQTIKGLMDFKSTSLGLNSQINNVTLLSKEIYFDKFMELARRNNPLKM